jgi:hypothetical protein
MPIPPSPARAGLAEGVDILAGETPPAPGGPPAYCAGHGRTAADPAGTAGYAAFILDKGVHPINYSFMSSREQKAQDAWLEARRNPAYYLTWEDRVPTKP